MIQVRTKLSKEFKAAYPRAGVWMVGTRLHSIKERVHDIKESLLSVMQTGKLNTITILDVQVVEPVEPVVKAKPKKKEK